MSVAIVTDEQAASLLPVQDAIPIVESALLTLSAGRAVSTPRQNLVTRLGTDRESVLKVCAAVLEERSIAGVRIASGVVDVVRHARRTFGTPVAAAAGDRYFGSILILSTRTGEPMGIVQDGYLSQLATSIPVGVAARCLARADANVVGILGVGAQARQQLQAVSATLAVKEVRLFTPRQRDAKQFANEMTGLVTVPIVVGSDPRDAVEGCDVVITATSALAAVLDSKWVNPGTHVSVTHPAEVPASLFARRPRIISIGSVRAETYALGTVGGLWSSFQPVANDGRSSIPSLAEVLCGAAAGRTSNDQITLFGRFSGHAPGVLWPALGSEVLARAHATGVGAAIASDWLLQARPS